MRKASLALLLLSFGVHGHDLRYTVSDGQAVVIRLAYPDERGFTFEAYEIYPQGEKLPFQVGRTDGEGRIAFLPDRAGRWQVKAWSEDGHGLRFDLTTDAAGLPSVERPFFERYSRIVVGVSLIFGLLGAAQLYLGRRR